MLGVKSIRLVRGRLGCCLSKVQGAPEELYGCPAAPPSSGACSEGRILIDSKMVTFFLIYLNFGKEDSSGEGFIVDPENLISVMGGGWRQDYTFPIEVNRNYYT